MGGGGVGGAEAVDWEETAVGVVGAVSDTSAVDTSLELPFVTGSSDSEAAGSSGERSTSGVSGGTSTWTVRFLTWSK